MTTIERADAAYDALRECRVVPVVKVPSPECAEPLAEALLAAGLRCVEVTFRSDAAAETIARMARVPGMLVGAGTVRRVEQAQQAISAGAAFLVSPATRREVVERALADGVAVCPGVCTPTEVEDALDLGATVLKFFPAGAYGGVKTLQALAAVYPDVPFFPTGGVSPDNLAEYLSQANVICCGGTWLAPVDLLAEGRYDEVERRAREAVALAASLPR